MNISTLREKLEKAKLFGALKAGLHEGSLNINNCFGITGIVVEPKSETFLIYGEEGKQVIEIDTLISAIDSAIQESGDIIVKGNIKYKSQKNIQMEEIKTVCVIAHKNDVNDENIDGLKVLLSLTDLKE